MKSAPESTLRELLRGGSEALAMRVAGIGLGYAFTLIVTRAFGAEAMGVFALSVTVLNVFAVFGRVGLDTALLRLVAEYSSMGLWGRVKEAYKKALGAAVPLSVLLSIALYLLSPWLAAHVFGKGNLVPYLRAVSFAIAPMAVMLINAHCLRGVKLIKEFAFLQHIAVMLFSVYGLVALLPFYRTPSTPVVAYVLGVFVSAMLSMLIWLGRSGFLRHRDEKALRTRDILGVSTPMLLSGSLFLIMQWTDTIMLGILRTEGEVGVYSVAVRVAAVTSITLHAINSIAAPKFAESYGRGDMASFRKTVRESTRIIFWTSFPVVAVLFVFPSELLGLFGAEFKGGADALLVLVAGQVVNAASGSVGFILQMTGRQRVHQNIIFVAALLNVLLNAALIPRFGINGAAVASAVSIAFWNLTAAAYIRYNLKVLTIYIPNPMDIARLWKRL